MLLYLTFLLGHIMKKERENPRLVWVSVKVRSVEYNQGVFCIFASIRPCCYDSLKEQILDSVEESPGM